MKQKAVYEPRMRRCLIVILSNICLGVFAVPKMEENVRVFRCVGEQINILSRKNPDFVQIDSKFGKYIISKNLLESAIISGIDICGFNAVTAEEKETSSRAIKNAIDLAPKYAIYLFEEHNRLRDDPELTGIPEYKPEDIYAFDSVLLKIWCGIQKHTNLLPEEFDSDRTF